MSKCRRCEKYRARLVKVRMATRQCLRDFNGGRDTGEAYAELRREGERIDRMLQREGSEE